ncbi:alpha-tectorin-like [Scomber scombrus]|uniref:Alpha-tectorin-like n=1 Tax=Scomber scombrus TaxID=13677 RepID=A0AAV1PKG4_SCOSC
MTSQIMLFVLLLGMISPLYPISGTTSSRTDDESSPRITLQRPFVYFERTYNQIYVNHNGHLTFDNPMSTYQPTRFPLHGSRDIIAPFWTDLDNRQMGQVYYNQYTSGSVLQQATRDINNYFPNINFNANWVFVATWYEVAYYPNSGTRTTVQAVLISGGQYSFILMNYGIIASTNLNVQAGYDTINSINYLIIPGSFSDNATGSNSNFRLSSNVNVPGRWAFQTDHGSRHCSFNGEAVQLGDSFWSDSTCAQKCTCTSTGLQCHNQPCSFSQICQPSDIQFSCQTVQRGTCTIIGDPHYYTFDNTVFHFQGTCTYVLSEQCGRGLPYYRVEGKNEHRGSTRVSWTRLVKVFVYNETIELVKGHRGEAKVNGNFAATPFYLNNGTVQVYESGFSVIFSTDFGLEVSYDTDHYVRISVPYTYQNATCGLCGNFNNDPGDDFRTRQVTAEKVPRGQQGFARVLKFEAEGTHVSIEMATSSRVKINGQIIRLPFSSSMNRIRIYHSSIHSIILHTSFGVTAFDQQTVDAITKDAIGKVMNSSGMVRNLCKCNGTTGAVHCIPNTCGAQESCRVVEGLDCPANSHYELCGTDCGHTCASGTDSTCEQVCSEGCFCNEGFVRSGTRCVPVERCGCQYDGFYYEVNDAEVSFPTTAGTLARVLRQGSYVIVDAGDLEVQFDGLSTLLVRIGQNRENRVTGMCGNFNSDSADDKVLPNGTLAQNDNAFGHSWKANTSQASCGSTDDPNDDILNDCPFREQYSELCSVITNSSGPFSACHLHSNPQPFFSSCVYDLCLYTPANGMLCSAVSAYERTCSVLGLNIPEWRSALLCAESDPCEHLDCTQYEWCGEKDGVYGCFCDEHHHRPNNESYDSSITCISSSGTMSLSRCQLFEAGFHPSALHLREDSCNGTVQDGRLVFHFNNDDQLCGTALRSNGTHFIYENTIQGNVDPHEGLISRENSIHLHFCCEYPLAQALSMAVGINPVASVVNKKLPSGQGHYHLRMIPYEDAGFRFPLTRSRNLEMEINQRLYIEVQTGGVDRRQISTILDSCWATPFNDASYPVHWDLITTECPNPEDGTVELVQNGISTVACFSFRMFTFTNFSSIYLHCQVHLCLLSHNNCTTHCYPGYHTRVVRDISHHDTAAISLGPILLKSDKRMKTSSASGQLTSMVTLLLSLLTTKTLT